MRKLITLTLILIVTLPVFASFSVIAPTHGNEFVIDIPGEKPLVLDETVFYKGYGDLRISDVDDGMYVIESGRDSILLVTTDVIPDDFRYVLRMYEPNHLILPYLAGDPEELAFKGVESIAVMSRVTPQEKVLFRANGIEVIEARGVVDFVSGGFVDSYDRPSYTPHRIPTRWRR